MHMQEEKCRFWESRPEQITGKESNPQKSLFRHKETGVYYRIHRIPTGKGGESIEIDQITDIHFNFCNDKDLQNEELADTVQCEMACRCRIGTGNP